jgi:hypothetical protein
MTRPLEIRIEGDGVSRETVDLADLAEILAAVRAAVGEAEEKRRPGATQAVVSLESIADGSLAIALKAGPRAAQVYSRLIGAIASDDPRGLSSSALRGADRLSLKARAKNWKIGLSNGNGHAAQILPDKPLFSSSCVNGQTALVVTVVRVGGEDKRTAQVRLADGKIITASVASRDLATQLGALLYQTIEVAGEARWSAKNGVLLSLRIDGIAAYAEASSNPLAAMRELNKLAGGFWDSIDPDQYVGEIRSE